uniref:DNA primase n=1 Tax=Parastrongyloides trichosuri TaxID=131310 RepID=A0A0N4ZNX9_PARTI
MVCEGAFVPEELENYLKPYYKHIFPISLFDPSKHFVNREFAFILENNVHFRYRSFENVEHFYQELCKTAPEKLDLGAIFNWPPKQHKFHSDYTPVEREFIIDIDLTDYDDSRTCCKQANICDKCFKFATIGIRILDNLLKEHFGFQHILFLFSGRRGIHCWVADEVARKMNNVVRGSVVGYIRLVTEHFVKNTIDVVKDQMHPVYEQSFDIILKSEIVQKMMCEQNWLDDEQFAEKTFQGQLGETIRDAFKELGNNKKLKWEFLKDFYYKNESNFTIHVLYKTKLRKFLLYKMYPRLDINVSTVTSHLLKSPFCIHPKTGCVAVPLDLNKLEEYKINEFPRIDQLIQELGENIDNPGDSKKYMKTSLNEYVNTFEEFVNNIINKKDL